MDKLLKILKNKWFLLGVSFISFIYVVILGKIVANTFTSYLEISNFSTFLIFYIFINFIFGVIMFFTRKQIPTMITAIIIPLEAFALMIVGFGQWFLIIPPVVVSAIIFLASGLAESCKTVMGTLLLIMFVVGGLAYSVMVSVFDITVSYAANQLLYEQDQDLDYATRQTDYLVTEDGRYRLVKYIEPRNNGTLTRYFVEEAFKDKSYPFMECRRVFGCKEVLASMYERTVTSRWIDNDTLYIDGVRIEMEELFAPKDSGDGEAEETTTAAETTATTTAAATETQTEETEEQTEEAA
ncbi:MAG: hypothetical protein NC203_10355 [Firmicutes bacterium]|nr:hypothetical protein [[Eubacterium] siraeum]MCM1488753.1 hypothetical protein [Bacillota bacterium]